MNTEQLKQLKRDIISTLPNMTCFTPKKTKRTLSAYNLILDRIETIEKCHKGQKTSVFKPKIFEMTDEEIENLTYQQIANKVGCSRQRVYQILRQGRSS